MVCTGTTKVEDTGELEISGVLEERPADDEVEVTTVIIELPDCGVGLGTAFEIFGFVEGTRVAEEIVGIEVVFGIEVGRTTTVEELFRIELSFGIEVEDLDTIDVMDVLKAGVDIGTAAEGE
jgi:hypothetical protein